jgi:toxin ParE1/3/4
MRVRLSSRARSDLKDLIRYIAHDSPRNARLVRDRINHTVQQLRQHPASGRPGRIDGTRELVIRHTSYIAVYRVQNGVLEIAALIHQSQQWPTGV